MRTYDLTPFYRSTVGFDRLLSLLDQATSDGSPGYPPYNIERTGENAYRITVAVSGFSKEELSIVAKENMLTIKGDKVEGENGKDKSEPCTAASPRAPSSDAFQLADLVTATKASLENGLLHVDLVRRFRGRAAASRSPRREGAAGRRAAEQVLPSRAPVSGQDYNAKTPRETGRFVARRGID